MQIAGIDEAGRGCWAGPLVAAAVILTDDIKGIRDSKRMSPKQRQEVASAIINTAYVGVGMVSAEEVDRLGLTRATAVAMTEALQKITIDYEEVIIDGNYNYLPYLPSVRTIIKADATVPAVSAASIVAKVTRDTYMQKLALTHPVYGFDTHVGYGTQAHLRALQLHGPCSEHRRSYKPVKRIIKDLQ